MKTRSILLLALLLGTPACLPLPPSGVLVVERRPPADRLEERGPPPTTAWIWIGGYWGWGRNDFSWVPGHWVRPDPGFTRWVPGRWVHTRRGWYWVQGYWR